VVFFKVTGGGVTALESEAIDSDLSSTSLFDSSPSPHCLFWVCHFFFYTVQYKIFEFVFYLIVFFVWFFFFYIMKLFNAAICNKKNTSFFVHFMILREQG
jgi:hypothetical protein